MNGEEYKELRDDMRGMRSDFQIDIKDLHKKIDAGFAAVTESMGGMRSDVRSMQEQQVRHEAENTRTAAELGTRIGQIEPKVASHDRVLWRLSGAVMFLTGLGLVFGILRGMKAVGLI